MALNFSASFAACLAAGLKVPRQFMYCIAQDPGAPYVVYKDGGGGGSGGASGGAGMMGPPPNAEWADHFANSPPPGPPPTGPSSHESPQHQQSIRNSQQPPQQQQQQQQQQHAGSPSPPYPQQQHTPANSLSAGPDTAASSHESTGASQDELACPELPSTPGPQQQQPQQQQQQQQQPHYYGSANNVPPNAVNGGAGGASGAGPPPNGSGNTGSGNGSAGGGNSGGGSGGSSSAPGAGGGNQNGNGGSSAASTGSSSSVGSGSVRVPSHPHPQHMLSPTAFMSYLKQPVVLTSLNSQELAEFHSEILSGGLKGMSSNGPSNGQGKNCELRLFKCLTCGKDFKQKSTLLQHERIHTDSRPYGCTECGKRFRQQSHLTQHLRIHANEKPFACVYCERTFRQRAILNQHLRIHSDVSPHLVYKNGQLWPQDVPFPGENNKDALVNLSQHGGSQYENPGSQGEANGQCFSPDGSVNQFPAYFKDSKGVAHGVLGPTKGLPELLQSGRNAGMPLYVRCPICQKEFKQKSTLLQHGCIHIESRPYPCAECGKRFRQQSHLTQHLRIHTNEKPYGCLYCGRNFRQRTILNQHVSTLHRKRLDKLERLMAAQLAGSEMSGAKKQLQLPINRIKTIMKSSPNVETIGQDALFAVTKSAELFIKFMVQEGLGKCVIKEKLEYKGLAEVAQTNGNLNFLTEILPRKLTVKECRRITEKDRERLETSDSSEDSSEEGNKEQ